MLLLTSILLSQTLEVFDSTERAEAVVAAFSPAVGFLGRHSSLLKRRVNLIHYCTFAFSMWSLVFKYFVCFTSLSLFRPSYSREMDDTVLDAPVSDAAGSSSKACGQHKCSAVAEARVRTCPRVGAQLHYLGFHCPCALATSSSSSSSEKCSTSSSKCFFVGRSSTAAACAIIDSCAQR